MGKKITLNERMLMNLVKESAKRVLKEYWTGADDAASAAHDEAYRRIEKEFQELIHNGKYDRQIEGLEKAYEYFLNILNREKEWLGKMINRTVRREKPGFVDDYDYDIVVRDVQGGVKEGSKNFDFSKGHRMNYQGNAYDKATLGYEEGDNLILKVRISIGPGYSREEHLIRPKNGYWMKDADGNDTNERIPGYDKNFNSEYVGPGNRMGEEEWSSSNPHWTHTVRRNNNLWSNDFSDEPKDMAEAYASLAIKHLAKEGATGWHHWEITQDRGNAGTNNYIVTIHD